ncbi:MAG: CinA family protein [Planctomycetaceae bacterium]|nr:CinA family protein [Planctomycetaceae bacterium]
MHDFLLSAAQDVASRLRDLNARVVFAESCTAGLIAATLARVPGISSYLCGSAVVYRNETKTAWLNVSADDLANERVGPVSEEVAEAMAIGVLRMTPEADIAASITGHLGPDAPADFDGVIVVGIVRRVETDSSIEVERVIRHKLTSILPAHDAVGSLRELRQRDAATFVLQTLCESLDSHSRGDRLV